MFIGGREGQLPPHRGHLNFYRSEELAVVKELCAG